MKKLLIVGASILQLPAVIKAKEMGLFTAVADYNPKAVAIPYADCFYNASTIDEQAIIKVAKDFKPDGIMTLATDMPMRSIAAASAELSLNSISYDTAIKSTDKGEMIKAFKEHSVACPWYYIIKDKVSFDKLLSKLTFPCIMKPIDSAGSRGIIKAETVDDLINGYEFSYKNSRSGAIIIEEYLDGNEVSVEVMATDGEIHILTITDKLTTGAPHFVELGHSEPSCLPKDTQEEIKKLAISAVKAVGIENGPAHVEIMATKNGPKMIELGARMGGDCITSHLVPLSTGIDMTKETINVSLGNKVDLTPKFNKGSAIRFLKADVGVIKEISGIEEAKKVEGVIEVVLTKSAGDNSTLIESSNDRLGYVIAQADSANEAVEICEKAVSKIKFLIE